MRARETRTNQDGDDTRAVQRRRDVLFLLRREHRESLQPDRGRRGCRREPRPRGSPRPVRRRHPERSQGEGHATGPRLHHPGPGQSETIRATAGRTRRREAAPASRRWGLHRRCRADGLDDRRDGALRIGLARDGSRDPGAGAGDDVRPRPLHHGEGVPEPPPRNLQPARPPRGRRVRRPAWWVARPVRLPELSDRPLLRRLRVHHHLPHPLGIHQPHRPDASLPSRPESSRSPAGHGPSRHRRRKC